MFDERAFIARVEAAGTDELAQLLLRPTLEQEKALRAHLGDARYQRMHGLALRRGVSRSVSPSVASARGNVVVIHGIMGAELSVSSGGAGDITWVNAFRIMRGWVSRLRLDADGRQDADPNFRVTASGIMKRYYGELLLSLSENLNVRAFWFDWRKDLDTAADELNARLNEWFGKNEPAHIVAHSMGGLVARTFIAKYPQRWAKLQDQGDAAANRLPGTRGGRLVMLGTPNYGSFAIPQVITGLEGIVRKVALLDLRHDLHDLLETFNSFVGSYQMLPSPRVAPEAQPLYDAATYGSFNVNVSQRHLTTALAQHETLRAIIDPARMIYVAGYDQPTFSGIANLKKLNSLDGYEVTVNGDGRVPHRLGLLAGVRTYYIKEGHGELSSNPLILRALPELLQQGETNILSETLPARRAAATRSQQSLREQLKQDAERDQRQLETSMRRVASRGIVASARAGLPNDIWDEDELLLCPDLGPERRKLEENLTRGLLSARDVGATDAFDEQSTGGADAEESSGERAAASNDVTIEIGLVYDGLESLKYLALDRLPVDAIAVGHYVGVKPQAAEKALDKSISAALLNLSEREAGTTLIGEADLILTQFTERGILRGGLAQPFFMPDPRHARNGAPMDRLIAIAGMDDPGRFGVPELTVLVRELCWSLGRLRRQHLATVLIGSGNGTLEVRDAVAAWLNGVRRALTGSHYDEGRQLRRITFIEIDPRKIRPLHNAIRQEGARQASLGLKVEFNGWTEAQLLRLKDDEQQWDQDDWERRREQTDDRSTSDVPTRVTLSLDAAQQTYRFGAITETASVPERDIKLDPRLVMQANDELVGEQLPAMQLQRGRFLEQLLVPDDLRRHLYNRAPLVMMLDATTARIHWEMVAQPELSAPGELTGAGATAFEYAENFLGTCRGFTRQLRTTFAPPPEPPPPPRRVLRVLVVADPAPDAHLPGAQEEGVAVADLFESYNVAYAATTQDMRVQVKRLFGPLEATRTNVLRELMTRPWQYDVLHFAGHCVFAWDGDPNASGWIFNLKERELLSANELNRIDKIPKFVFSNACESGITPDRSQERNAHLAPSFAEAFFARGVANFVCTAWPVDDVAAREFALHLYARLLGLKPIDAQLNRYEADPEGARPMHAAMREARVAIAQTENGRTTWGAYQHYGSPYLQFFYRTGQAATTSPPASAKPIKAAAKKAAKSGVKKTVAKKIGAKAKKRRRPRT